jgi:hypothetical protein
MKNIGKVVSITGWVCVSCGCAHSLDYVRIGGLKPAWTCGANVEYSHGKQQLQHDFGGRVHLTLTLSLKQSSTEVIGLLTYYPVHRSGPVFGILSRVV